MIIPYNRVVLRIFHYLLLMEKGKGLKLAKFLVEKRVDILYTRERFDGSGPEYVFSEAEVEVKKLI